jgi:serine/threonine-protein kinase
MAQLMYRIANEHAPDILKYNPSLPPALVTFLDRAMSKDAGERYQTGEEFAGALRACVGGSSATATGAGVDISL